MAKATTLKVNEIFYSIQGESLKTGLPTVFIRLTGCPLRCSYCDSEYAFHDGNNITTAEIINTVTDHQALHVTVTGGEPLAQKNCPNLLRLLCDKGLSVSLETSGAFSLAEVDRRVMKIVDFKTPGSNQAHRNKFDILADINPQDQIKFVLCNRADYEWAKKNIHNYQLAGLCEVLFSPAYRQLELKSLAEWILADKLNVRLQSQIHKYIWGETAGH